MMQPTQFNASMFHSAVIAMAGASSHELLKREFARDDERHEPTINHEIDSLIASAHQAVHDAKRALEDALSHGSGEHVSQCQKLLLEARGCLSEAQQTRPGKPTYDIARRIHGVIIAVRVEAAAIEAEPVEKKAESVKKPVPLAKPKKPTLKPIPLATKPAPVLSPIGLHFVPLSPHHPADFHDCLLATDLPNEPDISPSPTTPAVRINLSPPEPLLEIALPPIAPAIEPAKETPAISLEATALSVANDAMQRVRDEAAMIYEKSQAAKRDAKALADQLWNMGVSGLTHIGENYKITSSAIAGLTNAIVPKIFP